MARAMLAVALALLSGCGFKPIPFPTPSSELGNRPGLLTGKTGDAVLYRQ